MTLVAALWPQDLATCTRLLIVIIPPHPPYVSFTSFVLKFSTLSFLRLRHFTCTAITCRHMAHSHRARVTEPPVVLRGP